MRSAAGPLPRRLPPREAIGHAELVVQAWQCHYVGTITKASQYTIRNIPPSVDRALRRKAAEKGVSLNTLALRALEAEAGVTTAREHSDLDHFFGSWVRDAAVDRALSEVRKIEPGDWGDDD